MPPKKRRGRFNRYVPQDEERYLVSDLRADGFTQNEIADRLNISPKTLRLYHRHDLLAGDRMKEHGVMKMLRSNDQETQLLGRMWYDAMQAVDFNASNMAAEWLIHRIRDKTR
ncbi:regulatory LuxR family protein [Shimia isoporae]|uniref:Regulatory LuxR family protein n=1 Tax=Shimia isoporae TaxID=647720 RepID=A0A4R1N0H6_9RHOB|nr:helix-turn-helix domain-containing protein [Shimia isoporae]TCK99357.1 regulatory LuxR family protein [Shimia isoporae]